MPIFQFFPEESYRLHWQKQGALIELPKKKLLQTLFWRFDYLFLILHLFKHRSLIFYRGTVSSLTATSSKDERCGCKNTLHWYPPWTSCPVFKWFASIRLPGTVAQLISLPDLFIWAWTTRVIDAAGAQQKVFWLRSLPCFLLRSFRTDV